MTWQRKKNWAGVIYISHNNAHTGTEQDSSSSARGKEVGIIYMNHNNAHGGTEHSSAGSSNVIHNSNVTSCVEWTVIAPFADAGFSSQIVGAKVTSHQHRCCCHWSLLYTALVAFSKTNALEQTVLMLLRDWCYVKLLPSQHTSYVCHTILHQCTVLFHAKPCA